MDIVEWDSKGGSWQHAGGTPQPPWLFRRKGIPLSPPNNKNRPVGRFCYFGMDICRVGFKNDTINNIY